MPSLYIDLCNCLILICSIQHQMKVNLWTKNSYRLWLTNWPKTSKPLKTSVSFVTNGAIVIHTQRLKSDPGGNLLS